MKLKLNPPCKKHYPECNKLSAHIDSIHAIEEFLDFLSSKHFFICEETFGQYTPINTNHIIHDSFKIDQKKLERERREMLEDIRKNTK